MKGAESERRDEKGMDREEWGKRTHLGQNGSPAVFDESEEIGYFNN